MQNFKFIGAMVSEIRVFKRRKEDEESDVHLYFVPCLIFSYNFLHAVTFCHVLYLDVIRIETESEN